MTRIRIPIEAVILGLFPQSLNQRPAGRASVGGGLRLRALDQGLAIPSFWTRTEIQGACSEANRIWIREAEIEFAPLTIAQRTLTVPADEQGMWIELVNHLPAQRRGISVGFLHDLPSHEGGWGGGRIAVLAGQKIRSGLPGFAGNLLAHELGHVLIGDPNHATAQNDPSNLMIGNRNPRVANAGILNQNQIVTARRRAASL